MAEQTTMPVAVLAYQGTEPLLRAIWEKNYSGTFKILSVPDNYSLLHALADILADTEIADNFVLVQANLIPLTRISPETLRIPAIYVSGNGVPQYSSRVPTCLSKDKLADALAALSKESDFNAEKVIKSATVDAGRPIEVSHNFGNFIIQVFSGNPCRHKVIEGLLRRRFMGTTLIGWKAIEDLLQEFLKSKQHE
ncbi:MAG: hypothetical protein IJV27_12550 [Prevotella sp.]|nr:hypothetical protein [Prevotella sp.]